MVFRGSNEWHYVRDYYYPTAASASVLLFSDLLVPTILQKNVQVLEKIRH